MTTKIVSEQEEMFGGVKVAELEQMAKSHPRSALTIAYGQGLLVGINSAKAKLAAAPVTPSEEGEAVIKYVGTDKDSGPDDRHARDDEPRCKELIDVFRRMGDDVGQGLHPYWRWAFAAGFNEAKRLYTSPQPSPDAAARIEALEKSEAYKANYIATLQEENRSLKADRARLLEALKGLITLCEAAIQRGLDQIGIGLIDIVGIANAKQAINDVKKGKV